MLKLAGDNALKRNDYEEAFAKYDEAFITNPWDTQLIQKCLQIIGDDKQMLVAVFDNHHIIDMIAPQ